VTLGPSLGDSRSQSPFRLSNLESPPSSKHLPSHQPKHSHSHSHSHQCHSQSSHQPAPVPFYSRNPFSALSDSETPVPEYAPLIEVEAEVLSGSKWIRTTCLVDSGAQGSLVDRSFAESNDLPAISKAVPIRVGHGPLRFGFDPLGGAASRDYNAKRKADGDRKPLQRSGKREREFLEMRKRERKRERSRLTAKRTAEKRFF